MIYGI